MKAVMISIKPKWVKKIVSGKKTIEVRKSRPTLETPFKCYIYCTKDGGWLVSVNGKVNKPNTAQIDLKVDSVVTELNGAVIGEFVCDKIITVDCDSIAPFDPKTGEYIQEETCLDRTEFIRYTNFRKAFGWHISNLVIYDEPKELSEFYQECKEYGKTGTINTPKKCQKCRYQYTRGLASKCRIDGLRPLKRPPQSWCYVEELRGE